MAGRGSLSLTYRGTPALASAFVAMLRERGLAASWNPPHEEASVEQIVMEMKVSTVAGGVATESAVKAATEKFTTRFPLAAIVDIKHD